MYYTGFNSNWNSNFNNSCCPNNNIGWIYPTWNNNSNYAIIIVLFILLVIIIGTRWGR